ncbi:ABC transporter substrate-binding protein [Hyphomicrobium sp.]|uniref:ABC transporter substrate-binding protein n=1 Tax=Hyphomicrobium sp. TaxID=82 RepID=UPI000F9A7486|nr:ABC transporter substrate-binding protein [Hyphomicrobium sp.]RUO97764.1 MAG: ABC transporter [Hyphomicrobium sp.]
MKHSSFEPNWLRRIFTGFFAIAAFASLSATAANAAEPESTDPITISQSPWTGNLITSDLAAKLLLKMGYNAKVVPIDGVAVFPAMDAGDISFDVEIWESTSLQLVEASEKSGKSVKLGSLGFEGEDHWWYPEYVKEKCPGLPDYKALQKCVDLFKTPETGDKGQLLVYPVDWGTNDEPRVKTLGLDYQVVHAGSEAALLAQVKAAYQRKQPILAWLYLPHWAPAVYKGEFVKLPPYTPECYSSGTYGCEKPKAAITKMAWSGAKAKWPRAYKMIEAFQLPLADYQAMERDVDVDGKDPSAVVDAWMATHEAIWKPWIE